MTATPIEQSSRPGGRRILFAEDHEDVRRVITLLLMHEGYIVDEAENGAIALHLFRTNPGAYDVVITDHDMPVMTGVEFVEKLRESRFGGKVIVVSGGLTPRLTAAYLDLEADHILAKPVTCSTLTKLVEETCEPEASPVQAPPPPERVAA